MNKQYMVDGMMCKHCKNTVETAVSKLKGVKNANVLDDLKTLEVEFKKEPDDEMIKNAVEQAGYSVK